MYLEDFIAGVFFLALFIGAIWGFVSCLDAIDGKTMCVTVNTKAHVVTWQEEHRHNYFGLGFGKDSKTTYNIAGTAKYEGTKSLGFNTNVPDDAVDLMQDVLRENAKAPHAPTVLGACSSAV